MNSTRLISCCLLIAAVCLSILAFPACSVHDKVVTPSEGSSSPPKEEVPADLGDGLLVDSPVSHGISSEDIASMYKKAESMPFVYSVLILKDGYLVAEKYFHGKSASDSFYIASVTKSVLSSLVGLAIERGLLSLEDKMADYFPEYVTQSTSATKRTIRVKHLVGMTAGYPYDSEDARWLAWVTSPNWVQHAIEQPLVSAPGEYWFYSSGSAHILSAILTKVTKMTTRQFGEEYFFAPMNMKLRRWGQDPQGIYLGGWDMYFSSRDLAKFGLLYLNKGLANGKQVLSADWIAQSTMARSYTLWDWGALQNSRYGYLWWVARIGNVESYYAEGHGGQYVMVIPSLRSVIVTTADADNTFADGWDQSLQVGALIANYIVNKMK